MNYTKNDYLIFGLIIIISFFLFYKIKKHDIIEANFFDDIKNTTNDVLSEADKLANKIKEEAQKALNEFENIFGDIGKFLNQLNKFPKLLGQFGSELGKIDNYMSNLFNDVIGIFKKITSYISEFATEVETKVVNEENVVVGFITKEIQIIKDGVNTFFKNIENKIITEEQTAVKKVISIKTVFFKFYNVVKNNAKNVYNKFVTLIKCIITYFSDLYYSIFSYLQCGLIMLYNFPYCIGFYLLQIIGYIIYFPFQIVIWLLNLKELENNIFKYINYINNIFVNTTGVSILNFPQSVQNKCYKCNNNIVKMPCINNYIY